MNWVKYPFVRIFIFFSLGIISANYQLFNYTTALSGSVICAMIFLLLHFFRKTPDTRPFKGAALFLFTYFIGLLAFYIHHSGFDKKHIQNFKFKEYSAEIISPPSPYSRGIKVILEIDHVNNGKSWQRANGKIIGYFKSGEGFEPGKKMIVQGTPEMVKSPSNPLTFNYKEHLFNKGITHIHFIKNNSYRLLSHAPDFSINRLAAQTSGWYEKIVYKYIKGENERALVIGLILGSKTQLDPDLKKSYELTGLAHILAVSGAHVALLFKFFSLIFFYFKRPGKSEILFTTGMIVFLVFYTVLTGMTPPVIRASTMFTILLLGKSYKKLFPPIHTLFLSSFVILAFDPFALFDVGFQLSVVAVLSILLFYMPINAAYSSKNVALEKLWEIVALTLSAQVLTLPLVLYYFHHFPIYFILANVLAIFPAEFIIIASLLLVLTSIYAPLGELNGWIIEISCRTLNNIVTFIAKLPSPFENGIYFSDFQICLFTAAMVILLTGLYYRSLNQIYTTCLLFVALSFSVSADHYWFSRQKSFVVFHIPRHSVSAVLTGRKATVFSDLGLEASSKEFVFNCRNYLYSRGITSVKFCKIKQNIRIETNTGDLVLRNYTKGRETRKILDHSISDKITNGTGNRVIGKDPCIIMDGKCAEESIKKLNLGTYNTWQSGAFIKDF